MRKMVLNVDTSMQGTDDWFFLLVPDDMTQDQLNDYGFEAACQNAEMYGIYWGDGEDGATDDNGDTWEVYYTWANYEPELHDQFCQHSSPMFDEL